MTTFHLLLLSGFKIIIKKIITILQKSTKLCQLAWNENNVITVQRYFFLLEILDQQAFNQAPFNSVLFLSELPIHECMIEELVCKCFYTFSAKK